MKIAFMLAVAGVLLAGCSETAQMVREIDNRPSPLVARSEYDLNAKRQRELAAQHRRPDTGGGSND